MLGKGRDINTVRSEHIVIAATAEHAFRLEKWAHLHCATGTPHTFSCSVTKRVKRRNRRSHATWFTRRQAGWERWPRVGWTEDKLSAGWHHRNGRGRQEGIMRPEMACRRALDETPWAHLAPQRTSNSADYTSAWNVVIGFLSATGAGMACLWTPFWHWNATVITVAFP